MKSSAPSEASLVALQVLAKRLEPDGWTVRQAYVGEYFNIDIEHPLTSSFGIGFENDERGKAVFVDRALDRREFRVIAEAPKEPPHASLLGKIRTAAQVSHWSPEVVATVARVLQSEDLLTEAEAEWLEMAGPAWTEDEGANAEA